MSTTSKHRAVWNWLQQCSKITHLFFNFGTEADGSTIIVPSDSQVEEYISGATLREYTVELVRFLPLTYDANDSANIDMLEDIDAVTDWIMKQAAAGNYPAFPAGCTVTGIDVLNSTTGYAIAQNGVYAKYMIPFTINYIKE